MTKHYEQRKNANKRYLQKLESIQIRVKKGEKAKYKAAADAAGKSLNQFIIDCIEKEVKE